MEHTHSLQRTCSQETCRQIESKQILKSNETFFIARRAQVVLPTKGLIHFTFAFNYNSSFEFSHLPATTSSPIHPMPCLETLLSLSLLLFHFLQQSAVTHLSIISNLCSKFLTSDIHMFYEFLVNLLKTFLVTFTYAYSFYLSLASPLI